MSKIKKLCFGLATCILFNACAANSEERVVAVKQEQRAIDWFKDAKFGMFIHWGLYSQTGGIWEGKKYYGITEWLMRRGKINSADYKKIANDFNPTDFDAKKWVSIAKESGVKYIVITSKHHDGFAMFDSKFSKFDIVDATPYKRDPLKELTAAAREAGIKIGFYYSQYQDWTDPNAGGNNWEFDEDKKDLDVYLDGKAIPQLRELLTNYGPIDIIWFDTPGDMSIEDARKLKAWVKDLQPNCLVSDRVGHSLGDYKGYRDGEIPAVPQTGRPWEAIFTHNDSWGYSDFDSNFKSTSEVMELLLDTASKGGNLMLNIGPDGKGNFPKESELTFLKVGEWLKKNGESVYGTFASPLGTMPWGYITQGSGQLYLHVKHPPKDNKMLVPGLSADIQSVSFLANGKPLKWEESNDDLIITLPNTLPDDINSVIKLVYQGELVAVAKQATIISSQYDDMILKAADSKVNGVTNLKKYSTMHYFGDWKHDFTLAGLVNKENSAVWQIRVTEPGAYKFTFNYSAAPEQAGQEGVMSVNGKDYYFKVLETGSFNDSGGFTPRKPLLFIDHPIAVVRFDKPGIYLVSVRPDKMAKKQELFKLRNIHVESHR